MDKTSDKGQGLFVPGEGPANARVMLIGQNPGQEEGRQGRPFVGASGRFLNNVLAKNGLERDKLYITNVVKVVTPGNRFPSAAEVRQWLPCLEEEIERVRPRLIVLMGRLARQAPRREGITYIETDHPAAALRFPGRRVKFEADFRRVGELARGLG